MKATTHQCKIEQIKLHIDDCRNEGEEDDELLERQEIKSMKNSQEIQKKKYLLKFCRKTCEYKKLLKNIIKFLLLFIKI